MSRNRLSVSRFLGFSVSRHIDFIRKDEKSRNRESTTTMVILSTIEVLTYGLQYAGHLSWTNQTPINLTKLNRQRFRSAYGVGPDTLLTVIHDLQSEEVLGNQRIENVNIQELFTALSWLKQYPTEHNHAGHWKSTENTTRSKTWKYVLAIRKLIDHKVKWIVPDPNNPPEQTFLVSVDGTHCQISEPRNDPNKDWLSYKNKKPGLTYELAISVYEDKLVWINGPFRASVNDITIFESPSGLQEKLPTGKKAIADNAYSSAPKASTKNPLDDKTVKVLKKRARARHEIFNKRIKDFKILSTRFRSTKGSPKLGLPTVLDKHKAVFEACCVLVQYDVEEESPLIKV